MHALSSINWLLEHKTEETPTALGIYYNYLKNKNSYTVRTSGGLH